MDMQTLQYMEDRAQKARGFVDRIKVLNKRLREVKEGSLQGVYIGIGSSRIAGTEWCSIKVENGYHTEFEAHMLNAYISVTNEEVKNLEKQLAEL